jgi:hypothetical protein
LACQTDGWWAITSSEIAVSEETNTADNADAKEVMERIEKCGDVFVTTTGKPSEPIVGWITDNVVIENAAV